MGWNSKCPQGGPAGFTNSTAAVVVGNADFSQSVYVNISETTEETKQAYTYVEHTDTNSQRWRLCVVGHVHIKVTGEGSEQKVEIVLSEVDGKPTGNTFIPGWGGEANTGWDMRTPELDAKEIAALACKGSFPGSARYPTKLG
ncbi:MAG: hypothetical protein HY819_03675 [Acidobacteria bacterium]|nr:hypothetical protein [Acidobacteriota bacterium]